jgi:CDP-glycerol glycerophosphotransferase (TagB/SpsB family)
VQRWFARTAILITDYSSIFVTGDHVGRAGYFDHRRDGFGPVTETVGETVDAVAEILRAGRTPAEPYARRVAAAFPDRDGRCCRRVIAAIEASAVPRKPVFRRTS